MRRKVPKHKWRPRKLLTVCIAAIADNKTIVTASDRQISSGIDYEPEEPKIRWLTKKIACLTSGEMTIQTEIYNNVMNEMVDIYTADRSKVFSVKEVSDFFSKHYFKRRNEEVEREILGAYGLTMAQFIEQKRANPKDAFLLELERKISDFQFEDSDFIVCGLDETGPHIYLVSHGRIRCHDGVGFAVIGCGNIYAEAHLKVSKQSPSTKLLETLANVHHAKKDAEIDGGVGEYTDMAFIKESNTGTMGTLFTRPLETLYFAYKKTMIDIKRDKIKCYYEEIEKILKESRDKTEGDVDK